MTDAFRFFLECINLFFIIYLIGYSSFLFLSVVAGAIELYKSYRLEQLHNKLWQSYYIPVSILVPAYNEEECIEATVEELRRVAPEFDFVVINDGSRDKTLAICRRLGCEVVDMPINCGLTVGFQTAAKYALAHGYDAMVQFDADGQHKPEYIAKLVEQMQRSDSDIVVGSRFLNVPKGSALRMVGARMITLLIKVLTGTRVSDPTSGFRLFNCRVLELFATDDSLNPEPETIALLLRRGFKVSEVQVGMRERQGGESYLNLARSISYMARVFVSLLFVQWFR